jgi:hypothetical protein
MSVGVVRSLARTNKIALGLAVGTSAALGAAAVTGHGLAGPEIAGAFGAAGVVGVLNVRSNRPRVQPHVLSSVPEMTGGVVITAERARSMAAHPAAISHSDAA